MSSLTASTTVSRRANEGSVADGFENLDQRLAEAPFGRTGEHLFDERSKLSTREVDQVLRRCVPGERGEECKERFILGSDECRARRQMGGGVHGLVSGFLVGGSRIGLCCRQSRHRPVLNAPPGSLKPSLSYGV